VQKGDLVAIIFSILPRTEAY